MPHRILIADDNRDNADTIATILKMTGSETRTEYDGLAALEAAEEWHPDAILFDINMPKMDGLEACRQIQERQHLLAISMTGQSDYELAEQSRAAGFNYHFSKPVNLLDLMRVLDHAAG